MNKLSFIIPLAVLFSTLGIAGNTSYTKYQYSEPKDSDLGMTINIDIEDKKSLPTKFKLNKYDQLLLDTDHIDIKIVKDKDTNKNHLRLVASYDTLINNVGKVDNVTLYMKCPIDRSLVKYQPVTFKGAEAIQVTVLETETILPGSYKFLVIDSEAKSLINSSLGITGKPDDHEDLEVICSIASLAYSKDGLRKAQTGVRLKSYNIIE